MFKTNIEKLLKERELRTGETLSQGQIAKKVGLSRQTINNWFSGEIVLINADAAAKLSDFFGKDWRELVELVTAPKDQSHS